MIGETYAPALLRAKSAKKRKETGEERWYSRYDDKKKFWPMLKENLYRPLVMSVNEPIWSVSHLVRRIQTNHFSASSGTFISHLYMASCISASCPIQLCSASSEVGALVLPAWDISELE